VRGHRYQRCEARRLLLIASAAAAHKRSVSAADRREQHLPARPATREPREASANVIDCVGAVVLVWSQQKEAPHPDARGKNTLVPTRRQTSGTLVREFNRQRSSGGSRWHLVAIVRGFSRRLFNGIPRVAKTIADIPSPLRQRALEAAERTYRQIVRDLGYPEPDVEVWTCAVMFRVRSHLAEHEPQDGEGEAEIIEMRKAAGP
jgi:hypothetical protein